MALEIGAEILVGGMQARAPRRSGRLIKTIRKTKVFNDHRRHRLTIRAIVTSPYALYQEYGSSRNPPHPFVRPTQRIDGPIAVHIVGELLRR